MNLILLLLMCASGYAYVTGRSTARYCNERNGIANCLEKTVYINGDKQTTLQKQDVEARGNSNLDKLIREAIHLMDTFKGHENNVYNIVIKNREISGKLDRFIVRTYRTTMDTLKDAENFFRDTEAYIGQLTKEEQQLNRFIQGIIEVKGRGNTISNELQDEIEQYEQNQPFQGVYHIASDAVPVYQFHSLQDSPFIVTGYSFPQITWYQWRSKRHAFIDLNQFQQQDPHKTAIEFILAKLQTTLTNAVKYRMFLTALSRAFKNVKVYSQSVIRYLEELYEFHNEGLPYDSKYLMYSVDRLRQYWSIAKREPAIQITLMIDNINDSHATLSAITNRDWDSSAY